MERKVSKIARYSKFADVFMLGIPSTRKPKIPKEMLKELFKKPELRNKDLLEEMERRIKNSSNTTG